MYVRICTKCYIAYILAWFLSYWNEIVIFLLKKGGNFKILIANIHMNHSKHELNEKSNSFFIEYS